MIIAWTIRCIDNSTYEKKMCTSYDAQGKHVTEELVKKLFDRTVYVDTDKLSERDRIAIDIANARHDMLQDASFFHPLRHLFADRDKGPHRRFLGSKSFFDPHYHEDQDGNPMTTAQLLDSMNELRHPARSRDCKILHALSTRDLKIALLPPMQAEQFNFSKEQIASLNQFVNHYVRLMRCSAISAHAPVVLDQDGAGCKIVYNITDEQYNSSLLEFRNLYSEKEPAGFCKVVDILSDETIVKHTVANYIKECALEFEKLRDDGLASGREFAEYFGSGVLFEPEKVTGHNLIRWLLYTGRFHQPEKKNHQERENILKHIPDEAVVDFLAFEMLLDMTICISRVGSCCMRILNVLGKAAFDVPPRRISDAEKDFYRYVWEQRLKMADVIWRERGCPPEGLLPYCGEAWMEILKMFPFDVEALQTLNLLDPI